MLRTQQGDARIDVGNIHQDARIQAQVVVGLAIPAQGQFVGGAARDAFPGAVGDAGVSFGLEIVEREQFLHTALRAGQGAGICG